MKWEYKSISIENDELDDDLLNELGIEGWELVIIFDYRAYFKRVIGTKIKMTEEAAKLFVDTWGIE